MFSRERVIYTGNTSQDAHLLKSLLAEEGIRAIVVNDVLERGAGVDLVGWPTLARVVVAEEDAERARHLALAFDRRTAVGFQPCSTTAPLAETAEEPPAPPVDWPRCPSCDARRTTRCPVCGTAGDSFLTADAAPAAIETALAAVAAEESAARAPRPLLLCPTCDEPFAPEYPRVCQWCGHEFADGYEPDLIVAGEGVNLRVLAAVVGLALLATLVSVYFALLV